MEQKAIAKERKKRTQERRKQREQIELLQEKKREELKQLVLHLFSLSWLCSNKMNWLKSYAPHYYNSIFM